MVSQQTISEARPACSYASGAIITRLAPDTPLSRWSSAGISQECSLYRSTRIQKPRSCLWICETARIRAWSILSSPPASVCLRSHSYRATAPLCNLKAQLTYWWSIWKLAWGRRHLSPLIDSSFYYCPLTLETLAFEYKLSQQVFFARSSRLLGIILSSWAEHYS